jgi:hypothetical protein
MATTLTTIVDDVLVIDAIQGALKNALVPINAFSFGIDVNGKAQNDVIRVPVITAGTTEAKTPGTASTSYSGATGTSLTLSNYRCSSCQLNEGAVSARNAGPLFAAMAAESTYVLAKYVIDTALALVTAANYGDTGADKLAVAAADFGQEDLADLMAKAEDKKLGRVRSLLLNASYASRLFGSSSIALLYATGGQNVFASGQLPPVLGMQSYMYSGLPANSENLGGLVCDKGAIGIGMAPTEQLVAAGEGNKIADTVVTDPGSQVVCRYIRMADADGGYHKGRVELIFGVGKIQNSLIRIVSA